MQKGTKKRGGGQGQRSEGERRVRSEYDGSGERRRKDGAEEAKGVCPFSFRACAKRFSVDESRC